MSDQLSHIDASGNANLVDVSDKQITSRHAIATGVLITSKQTLDLIKNNETPKGDVLSTARIAGIMGAKKTSDLIPLCHPLMISSVKVDLELDDDLPGIHIAAKVKVSGQTGVEMEALTAVNITALTLYDMLKAVDKGMVINNICLQEKVGGKSEWVKRCDPS